MTYSNRPSTEVTFGLAGQAQVLEVGVGLALGHRPQPPWNRCCASSFTVAGPAEVARRLRAAREPLLVVALDGLDADRADRRTGGRGRAARCVTPSMSCDLVERGEERRQRVGVRRRCRRCAA